MDKEMNREMSIFGLSKKYIHVMNNKPNILLIVHDWYNLPKNIGGTTLHVYDLIISLNKKYNFHVFSPFHNNNKLFSYTDFGTTNIEFHIPISDKDSFYSTEYKVYLTRIIKAFRINLIHIHHMLGHFFDIIDVAKINNIPYIISIHDFYCLCPLLFRIDYQNNYCDSIKEEKCNYCIKQSNLHFSFQEWRGIWKLFFSKLDKVITPSSFTMNEISRYFKTPEIEVIEHGLEIRRNTASILNINNDSIFNIAFVGFLKIYKGELIINDIIKDPCRSVIYHFFGADEKGIKKSDSQIKYHGRYKRKELKKLFSSNSIKLVCIFSICSETFCYTFMEAIAYGIPVLAFDLGNVGQKIKEYNLGWLIPANSTPNEINNILLNIFRNKEEYASVSRSVTKYRVKTIEDMANNYDNTFHLLIKERHSSVDLYELDNFIIESRKYKKTFSYTFLINKGHKLLSKLRKDGLKITFFSILKNYKKYLK